MSSDLIVFGEDWGAHPSSTQHLMKHIAQTRRTLWVNSLGLRRPKLSLKDARRLVNKGRAIMNRQKVTHKDTSGPLEIIAPRAIPWPGQPLAQAANKIVLGQQLRTRLAAHNMTRPIVWTSLPTAVDVVDHIKSKAVIYYCGDDFNALDGVDHAPVQASEHRLAQRADLILAASDALAAKFPSHKTITLPHGVDFDLFATPAPRASSCPRGRPIAGFYGSIAPWIDVTLIAETARKMPDWDFMFIGPVKTDISALKGLANIKWVSAQSHDALPGFVQHWQAALLPFKDNDQIRACNPLKLREYLASGTPVVTTNFPALGPYKDQVKIVKTADDLARTLRQLKRNPMQSLSVERESWCTRARYLNDLLAQWD